MVNRFGPRRIWLKSKLTGTYEKLVTVRSGLSYYTFKQLNAITQPKRTRAGQSVKAFNPLSIEDQRVFKALLAGSNTINGFRNRDIRFRLAGSPFIRSCGGCVAKQSAKVSRLLKRFHIFGLIAKIPRSRRWRLTKKGWALLSCAISLKEQTFPQLHAQAVAI